MNVGPGTYWLFPASSFVSGTINVYVIGSVRGGGIVHAVDRRGRLRAHGGLGEAAAQAICAAAHADGREYTVLQQALNLNLYLCVGVAPTATNTAIPPSNTPITPTATNTLVPPTNTTVPQTLSDPRAIAAVRLSSANPGELSVDWDAPGETARDYRVSWAKVGEAFRTWTDLDYNAYPTAASLTISGLEGGSRYKVMVRARYDGGAGPWTGEVEATVMDEESLPPTNTAIPPTNTAIPPTNTAIPPTNTAIPPTNTDSDSTDHTHRDSTDKHSDSTDKHSDCTDEHSNSSDKYCHSSDKYRHSADEHSGAANEYIGAADKYFGAEFRSP